MYFADVCSMVFLILPFGPTVVKSSSTLTAACALLRGAGKHKIPLDDRDSNIFVVDETSS